MLPKIFNIILKADKKINLPICNKDFLRKYYKEVSGQTRKQMKNIISYYKKMDENYHIQKRPKYKQKHASKTAKENY